MKNHKNNQKGFAALYITVVVLGIVFAIAINMSILSSDQQKISTNIIKSSQAYYLAESGVEDALLRLTKGMKWTNSYTLATTSGTAGVKISAIIGGARTITSAGNNLERIRKVQVVYQISSEKISFHYGAQVGEGGIEMLDTTKIDGNVFSNGNVIKLSGKPEITGTVKIAKNVNRLEGVKIGKDAYVYRCLNSNIGGKLTTTTSMGCSAASYDTLSEEIAVSNLPITEEQIQNWRDQAFSGGVRAELILSGKKEFSLGPKKIEGRLIVQDTAKLRVTGTLWVSDEIVIQNGAQVFLDRNSYGGRSGVILSDSKITIQDTPKVSGSGERGSYLMLLSTFKGVEPAFDIQDSPEIDIIYASQGKVQLQDSIKLREVIGWGLKLQNKARVIYEAGLADVSFTSGPGGSWEVASWRETQ